MEELMAPFGGGDPSEMHCALHQAWAQGGWGMIISGKLLQYSHQPIRAPR